MSKILFVDDDYYIRFIYTKVIAETTNLEVKTVGDWIEGRVHFLHQLFDLVILDINLPEITGIEALREIRQLRATQKVLIISAYGTRANIVAMASLKANGFVVKPFTTDALLDKINHVLMSSEK
ncbi:MAG: response regulator [Candidatus Delongbacteria bacterium]|nr:response regulator [Candidatus Delongbacteria bacterium]